MPYAPATIRVAKRPFDAHTQLPAIIAILYVFAQVIEELFERELGCYTRGICEYKYILILYSGAHSQLLDTNAKR